MANDFHEIAMIGDRDSVLLAKAAGLAVFAETDGAAATRRIHSGTIQARIRAGDNPHSRFARQHGRCHGADKEQR